jgi:hypothetical protein
MPAIFDRVLTVNLIANTAIFYVAARLYLLPLVPRVRPQQILVPILLLLASLRLPLVCCLLLQVTQANQQFGSSMRHRL